MVSLSTEYSDEGTWLQAVAINEDAYSREVILYAERWARLMQMELASGKKLTTVAAATSARADVNGITGAMHGAAVYTLAQTWRYGAELMKWHERLR